MELLNPRSHDYKSEIKNYIWKNQTYLVKHIQQTKTLVLTMKLTLNNYHISSNHIKQSSLKQTIRFLLKQKRNFIRANPRKITLAWVAKAGSFSKLSVDFDTTMLYIYQQFKIFRYIVCLSKLIFTLKVEDLFSQCFSLELLLAN